MTTEVKSEKDETILKEQYGEHLCCLGGMDDGEDCQFSISHVTPKKDDMVTLHVICWTHMTESYPTVHRHPEDSLSPRM